MIPNSVEEQQRIANALTQMDDAINSSSRLIAKYEQVKRGLMHDLLTYGIDQDGNIRSEQTHQFKDSPIGRIPVEWEVKKLSEIYTHLKSGITPSRDVPRYFEHGIYPWVKTLDLNEGEIWTTDECVTDFCLETTSLQLLPCNTILIAMYGGWEQIGRTAILKIEAGLNQAVCGLYSPVFNINAYYMLAYLQVNRLRWRKDAISTRKDPNISKSDIENFYVAFPKNRDEQNLIVKSFSDINKTIEAYKNVRDRYVSTRQGLLSDLITGKVRI